MSLLSILGALVHRQPQPPLYGPPEPSRCPNRDSGRCELIALHPLPHYRLTAMESGIGGWRRCGWSEWPSGYGDADWRWRRTWPGTMTADLEAKNGR